VIVGEGETVAAALVTVGPLLHPPIIVPKTTTAANRNALIRIPSSPCL
jgi:hypothetical protein